MSEGTGAGISVPAWTQVYLHFENQKETVMCNYPPPPPPRGRKDNSSRPVGWKRQTTKAAEGDE